ncbi:tellurite resistance TerB family protein [Vibrio methylphosphonaticus]|uniref:tellurite resistance TerB family protein n=1 Tax=Vibrio methylphosphonaticus TaxID=2946866 RepID=UPI00202A0672|nr:tellurite resistance TerB family protein [Vibrio methylphosphonaticus]MCL9776018.1 tellurite resistance TerB family protein [Vibrio methylphosphonaticus]
MDLKSLLNQALKSDVVSKATQKASQSSSSLSSAIGDKKTMGALGAGVVGGGLLGMLMGSKKTKKVGKTALGVGSAAALGALAFKIYNDWDKKNDADSEGATVNEFANVNHEEIVLKAMIGAAKADGHIDDVEMGKIDQALQRMHADAHVQALVQAEIAKPLDPSYIAQLAHSPEQGAEIYLASLLVVDEQNFMEKAYLQELAKQLQLPSELVSKLDAQVF